MLTATIHSWLQVSHSLSERCQVAHPFLTRTSHPHMHASWRYLQVAASYRKPECTQIVNLQAYIHTGMAGSPCSPDIGELTHARGANFQTC